MTALQGLELYGHDTQHLDLVESYGVFEIIQHQLFLDIRSATNVILSKALVHLSIVSNWTRGATLLHPIEDDAL